LTALTGRDTLPLLAVTLLVEHREAQHVSWWNFFRALADLLNGRRGRLRADHSLHLLSGREGLAMKSIRRFSVLVILGFLLQAGLPLSLCAAPFAYITNAADDTVSIIDTATNTVTATVPVGLSPYGVAVSSDGARVFVANYNGDTISVISTATNTVTATVPVGFAPTGIAVTPDGARVYVANTDAYTVSVISTATNTVTATVPVAMSPIGVAVTPDGTRVYVANKASDTVSVISTATNSVTGAVSVGNLPMAFGRFIGPGPGGATVASKVGVFRPGAGTFYLDVNGSGTWEGCGTDRCLAIGMSGDIPLVGDWNGTGSEKVGLFRPSDGTFYLDFNGNGQWDGCGTDRCLQVGLLNDLPVVGDWNGTGRAQVGVFRPSAGTFYLDYNGNGVWDGCGTDRCLQIGVSGDVPLVGDWNHTGTSKVGVFRPSAGTFYLDYNGNGVWDGCGSDRCLSIGLSGDIPLVGDWNGTGGSKVGVFRPTDGTFYLDYNGSGTWEGCGTDRCSQIGLNGDTPLVGDWTASGTSKVGVFRPTDGTFYLDYNGSGTWEGCGTDRCLSIGMNGDTPLVGKW
jgi:YVTN family beta-propeller protein